MSLFSQFTGSSTLNYPQNINESVRPIDILIVGGGGSGSYTGSTTAANGTYSGGGGGGGEVIDIRNYPVFPGNSFNITIGSGGPPGLYANGGDTTFVSNDAPEGFGLIVAKGGGHGGGEVFGVGRFPANGGGSGGGGSSSYNSSHEAFSSYGAYPGAGESSLSVILNEKGSITSFGEFKSKGGEGIRVPYRLRRNASLGGAGAGGGGGGAGGPGEDGSFSGTANNGGSGGSGYYYDLVPKLSPTGNILYYGSGGPGWYLTSPSPTTGSIQGNSQVTNVLQGFGWGGLGGVFNTTANAGGPGIVIVSYSNTYGPLTSSTGNLNSLGTEVSAPRPGYRVYSFPSSGNFTI